jgi:hypothetical protein
MQKLTTQFLATAPTRWTDVSQVNLNGARVAPPARLGSLNADILQTSSRITKFQLPNSECISCILWNGLYHITGTDIGEFRSVYWMLLGLGKVDVVRDRTAVRYDN